MRVKTSRAALARLRRALVAWRCSDSSRTRVRVVAGAVAVMEAAKHGDADLIAGGLKGLATELAAAERAFRRGLARENTKGNGGGLPTGRAGGADHLGVKCVRSGHEGKRATRKGKGKTQPEGAGREAARAA